MKRNMDLMRDLMLLVESHGPGLDTADVTIEGRSPEEVEYHFRLMVEGGLLAHDGVAAVAAAFGRWTNVRLTWDGHEFLDVARAPHMWQRAKWRIEKYLESTSFEVLKWTLTEIAKRHLDQTNLQD